MDIIAENVSFCYPKAHNNTLDGISFHIYEGKITSIIGANGVGKSTLVKVLSGVLRAEGKILVGGKNINSISRENLMKSIGYLTQENSYLSSLTVFEMVMLGKIQNLKFKVDTKEAENAWSVLDMLGIADLAERPFYALSGGQRRMVGLAQMFVKKPEILILDEPTANLDIQNELEMLELIKDYTVERNISTLLILHDLNMASRYSDELVLMNKGKVYKTGKPSEVFTEESIREAYGVNVHMHMDKYGVPMINVINSVREKKYNFQKENG